MEINDAPDKAGVYIFKDKNKKPIYIGKAASLKKRLSSYLNPKSFKTGIIVSNIASCEWILCDSELEALLLEANLVRKHKPKFNVCLKDDKAYPFIKITKEAIPRILTTRRLTKDGYYFGPYRGETLRKTIKITKELFKIRSCKTMPKDKSPCLLSHLGQCLAPCKGEIDEDEYNNNVVNAISFLSGKQRFLLKILTKEMKKEASSLNFEKAQMIRDRIFLIKSLSESQKVFFIKPINCDVVGTSIRGGTETIFVFVIREGRLIGDWSFTIAYSENAISSFIKQFYLFATNIPDEILVEEEIEDKALISSVLSERQGKKVLIKIPRRGKKRELLLLAKKNASLFSLRSSKRILGFSECLGRIACVDISNISAFYATGSIVIFENGNPNKDEYRRFKIRAKGQNDYGMIKEVLERYFKGLIKENKPFPDLVLVDGGKGHLNLAINTLKNLNVNNVSVIAIAKKPDRIFQKDLKEPLELRGPSIFQYIRDEAHRFALLYHKGLRHKEILEGK